MTSASTPGDTADAGAPAGAGHRGLLALCTLARLHQVPADPASLAHQLNLSPGAPLAADDLVLAARHLGLQAREVTSNAARLLQVPLPALAMLHAPGEVVLLAQCDGDRVLLLDAASARPSIEPLAAFAARWSQRLILVSSRASLSGNLARFDFSWFLPSLVRHRRLLGEVLLISLVLQLLALVSPLFFQVVVDKVLVHGGHSTLDVLVAGLAMVIVFEGVLGVLRARLLVHTTSRIDVELGARLFRHLVRLPLAYFQARRVGDSVARVRELESIRGFLTGPALTVVLDLLFAAVFVAVMAVYSIPLTLIVLASLPLYAGLSLLLMPLLRRRLDMKFARGAESQALLVETVTGMQTVKSGALEPALARRWDQQLAAYVHASLRAQNLATGGHECIQLIGKLVQAAVVWWGAHLVMERQLSIGQFVAFQMFAQRVAQPILRMAQLWTDFQQTGISVARLGDILNTPTEHAGPGASQLPPIRGHIRLDAVSFRYPGTRTAVLDAVSLDIRPGEVMGIVGRSGSGKTTLTRLVQRLDMPEEGRILVDGIDTRLVDAAQLRRQIGVVLQDNQLFHRTVRENIAITDPAAPLDQVVQAARLAGAHDFICALPQGYDTLVGEQGSSLSGGQRQRIAIARALFGQPRILILDEATSALDYESEAAIQRNMARICAGRTVLIVAHRLSTVCRAHRIAVMDRGHIVACAPHTQLLQDQTSLYARLWRLQTGQAEPTVHQTTA